MDLDELAAIVAPEQTAIITQECQLGVIGPKAALPQLAEAARDTGMIDNVARLVEAGRAAGVHTIHPLATHRPDLKGANHNARLFRAMARRGGSFHPSMYIIPLTRWTRRSPATPVP